MKRFYRFINGPKVIDLVSNWTEVVRVSRSPLRQHSFPSLKSSLKFFVLGIYDFGVDFRIRLLLCRRTFRAYFAIPTPPKMARLSSSGI